MSMSTGKRKVWLLIALGVSASIAWHLLSAAILWSNRGCFSDGCLWLALVQLFPILLDVVTIVLFAGFGFVVLLRNGSRFAPKWRRRAIAVIGLSAMGGAWACANDWSTELALLIGFVPLLGSVALLVVHLVAARRPWAHKVALAFAYACGLLFATILVASHVFHDGLLTVTVFWAFPSAMACAVSACLSRR